MPWRCDIMEYSSIKHLPWSRLLVVTTKLNPQTQFLELCRKADKLAISPNQRQRSSENWNSESSLTRGGPLAPDSFWGNLAFTISSFLFSLGYFHLREDLAGVAKSLSPRKYEILMPKLNNKVQVKIQTVYVTLYGWYLLVPCFCQQNLAYHLFHLSSWAGRRLVSSRSTVI